MQWSCDPSGVMIWSYTLTEVPTGIKKGVKSASYVQGMENFFPDKKRVMNDHDPVP